MRLQHMIQRRHFVGRDLRQIIAGAKGTPIVTRSFVWRTSVLFNVLGKMMHEENGEQNFYEIDMRELPAGSYVLLLGNGKITDYHRIIKY